jgi:hypothetical protein
MHRNLGRLLEIPMATNSVMGVVLPAAGGGYLRQLPFALLEGGFRKATEDGVPAMFYVHPWETDPGQPRLPVPWVTRVRHYRGLRKTLPRIKELLAAYPFSSVERRFQEWVFQAEGAET